VAAFEKVLDLSRRKSQLTPQDISSLLEALNYLSTSYHTAEQLEPLLRDARRTAPRHPVSAALAKRLNDMRRSRSQK